MNIGVKGAKECLEYFINTFKFKEVMDVGCGSMPYSDLFLSKNIDYNGIDIRSDIHGDMYTCGNFMNYPFSKQYNAVISSHVVEHVPNTEQFLNIIRQITVDNGNVCIIFPKPKPNVVGGHVHIFNPGIMLYNLTRIGIDCSDWKCVVKDYSFAVMGTMKKTNPILPQIQQ